MSKNRAKGPARVERSPEPNGTGTGAIPRSVRVEVRPGEGGEDAYLFAEELTAALVRHAERAGSVALRETGDSRTFLLTVEGGDAQELRELAGTHRVQRVPVGDKKGRRHTSTATVAVVEDVPETVVELRDEDLQILRYRGSGPGGQHRNKVSSAIRVKDLSSGLVVTMEHGRSQYQNLQWAKEELKRRLTAQERERSSQGLNSERRGQIADAGRPAKTFTHNEQRDEVVDHARGRRWTRKAFARGAK